MPYKDPEKRRAYHREYQRKRFENDPEYRKKLRAWRKEWAKNNPERVKERKRVYHRKLKLEVLTAYGGNPPRCACCGEAYIEFLEIDHQGGNGKTHRAKVGTGTKFYQYLRKNGYPDLNLRVLCSNCNNAYGRYGFCPHQTMKNG